MAVLAWPGLALAAVPVVVSPYTFSLDPDSHQLHTTWEVAGASASFLCAFADFAMVEIGFTGKEQVIIFPLPVLLPPHPPCPPPQLLDSGNSWAVECLEQEVGDKMVVEVDITKYRVQPFK